MAKLTKQNIKQFWKFVDAAVKDLKLTDWNIQKAVDPDMDPNTLATCAPMFEYRKAAITLNTSWDLDIGPIVLSQIAVHEVFHILLAEVMHLGSRRWTTEKEFDEAEHEVIRRLVPVIIGEEEEE